MTMALKHLELLSFRLKRDIIKASSQEIYPFTPLSSPPTLSVENDLEGYVLRICTEVGGPYSLITDLLSRSTELLNYCWLSLHF